MGHWCFIDGVLLLFTFVFVFDSFHPFYGRYYSARHLSSLEDLTILWDIGGSTMSFIYYEDYDP